MSSFLKQILVENLRPSLLPKFASDLLPYIEHFGTEEKLRTMMTVDPNAVLVAQAGLYNHIGCLTGVDLLDRRAHFGGYIVKPEYRNQGIGKLMIKKVLDRFDGYNISMYCSKELVPYMRKNFGVSVVSEWSLLGFQVKVSDNTIAARSLTPPMGIQLKLFTVGDEDLKEKIASYDQGVRDYRQPELIRAAIEENGVTTFAAVDEGKVCGYGSIRPLFRGGWRLGPLYADNEHVARLLLERLALSLSPANPQKNRTFLIWLPEENSAVLKIVKDLGSLECTYRGRQACTKELIELPFDKIYAFRSTRICPE